MDALVNGLDLRQNGPGPELNAQDPTIRLFWLLMAGHFFVWVAVCLLTQPNMPLDMVEMLYWGQQWQLGYHKHPPLPAWLAATTWEFGGHHPWAMYAVAQLTIVTTFWAVWQLAREALSPWCALASVAVLEGCYYCTFLINDINNTIVTRPMWALTILFVYRGLTRSNKNTSTCYWCLAGLTIGLGMLCKYYMAVLVICLMTVPIFIPRTRRALRTSGPWLTTAIAIGVFLPHSVWMINHDFISIRYVLDRSRDAALNSSALNNLLEPLKFVGSQMGAVIPVLLLALPLYMLSRKQNCMTASDTRTNSDPSVFHPFLAIAFWGPIAVYLLVGGVTGASFRSAWGGPLFSFLGVYTLAKIKMPNRIDSYQLVIRNSVIVGMVMVMALVGRNVLGPIVMGKGSRVHFPGHEVSRLVNDEWNSRYDCPLPVVGGQMFISGCVGVYSEHHVDVYGAMSPSQNPWVDDERLIESGGIIVWDQKRFGDVPPDGWLERFQYVERLDGIECQSVANSSLKFQIGAAIVHPKSNANRVSRHLNSDHSTTR